MNLPSPSVLMEQRVANVSAYDKDFWNNLEKLRKTLIIFWPRSEHENGSESLLGDDIKSLSSKDMPNDVNQDSIKKELLKKIKLLFNEFVNAEDGTKNAAISMPNRKLWKNTNFKKDKGIELVANPALKTIGQRGPASSKRLVLFQHLLTKIYRLIETDTYKTKREIYYEDVPLFKTQTTVDALLDDIACLLNVSKIHLHVLTTSKGCITGRVAFKDADGNYIDCAESAEGILIPSNIQEIRNIQSDARFILVVEKSAVFQMLLDSKITSLLHPCIMITGKGFPDVNTRELLKKLTDALEIPVLGLFDADPYGIEILGIYKYGSKAMAFDVKNLAVPQMRWLGLLPTDVQRLNLPKESMIQMTDNDIKKAKQLLNLPYIQQHTQWLQEIQFLLKTEKKVEIEGLSKLSSLFLPMTYLPNKIKFGSWI